MSESTLSVGDVVTLKSGGPDMTVARLQPNSGPPSVECVWFPQATGVESCRGSGSGANKETFPVPALNLAGFEIDGRCPNFKAAVGRVLVAFGLIDQWKANV